MGLLATPNRDQHRDPGRDIGSFAKLMPEILGDTKEGESWDKWPGILFSDDVIV